MIGIDTGVSLAVILPLVGGMAALLWRMEYNRIDNYNRIVQLELMCTRTFSTFATRDGLSVQTNNLLTELKGMRMDLTEEIKGLRADMNKELDKFNEQMDFMRDRISIGLRDR